MLGNRYCEEIKRQGIDGVQPLREIENTYVCVFATDDSGCLLVRTTKMILHSRYLGFA